MKPFRWDIKRREQLGNLVDRAAAESYSGFESDLLIASAKVISRVGDADIGFVGRSPESLFDYLSGLLADTTWSKRLLLLNLSFRYHSPADIRRSDSQALDALHSHLSDTGVSPRQLVGRRPLAMVDLVSTGSTFRNLTESYMDLAERTGTDRAAVRRKLRFVGITWRTKNSPNTYRWHQHAGWLDEPPRISAKNVSIPGEMWAFLGNTQAKVTPSNPPWRWSDSDISSPPRDEANLNALALAVELYDLGSKTLERRRFATELGNQYSMRYRWCRQLVAELRY